MKKAGALSATNTTVSTRNQGEGKMNKQIKWHKNKMTACFKCAKKFTGRKNDVGCGMEASSNSLVFRTAARAINFLSGHTSRKTSATKSIKSCDNSLHFDRVADRCFNCLLHEVDSQLFKSMQNSQHCINSLMPDTRNTA